MRKLSLVAVLTALAFTSAVSATTVNLVWTGMTGGSGLGTNTWDLTKNPGSATATLDVVVGVDAAGLLIGELDLEFDTDGQNELDIAGGASGIHELTWSSPNKATCFGQMGSCSLGQISGKAYVRSQESGTGGPEGQAFGMEAFTLGNGPATVTLTFARVVFTSSGLRARTDLSDPGFDIFETRERDPGLGFFNQASGAIVYQPLQARVIGNAVPEPGTVGLLGLGLAGLAAASRRRA